MTPEELRLLADEATPGPWTTEKRQGDVFVCNPPWQGYEGEWVNHADARLIALAPDLARLCAEQHEALEQILSPWNGTQHPSVQKALAPARAVLAKFSELKPVT